MRLVKVILPSGWCREAGGKEAVSIHVERPNPWMRVMGFGVMGFGGVRTARAGTGGRAGLVGAAAAGAGAGAISRLGRARGGKEHMGTAPLTHVIDSRATVAALVAFSRCLC